LRKISLFGEGGRKITSDDFLLLVFLNSAVAPLCGLKRFPR